jgi:hypothetical protein
MWVRRYTLRETPDVLLRRLKAAEGSDAAAERSRQLLGKVGLWGVAGFVLLFFLVFAAVLGWPDAARWVVATLALWTVGGLLLALFLHLHALARDLDDHKLAALQQLVSLLRADVPHGQPLQLVVDFRDYRKGRRQRLNSFWASFFGGISAFAYRHEWLRLQAPLADGSTLLLCAVDVVKRKERRKRKGRVRVGERLRSAVDLHLRLGKGYEDGEVIAARLQEQGHPLSLTRATASGHGRQVSVGFRSSASRRGNTDGSASPTTLNGDTILRALRFTYGALAPRHP